MAYKPLTESESNILSSKYFEREKSTLEQSPQPTAFAIAGQPGAGKTAAANTVEMELSALGGGIRVNADIMRGRIPLHGEKPAPEETQADASTMASIVRKMAVEERMNIIEEGTFRDAEGVAKWASALRSAGYRVEMMAVATSKEESLVGTFIRYERDFKEQEPNPRAVAEGYQKMAFDGFNRTVATQGDQFDRLRVVNRSGEILFDSQVQEKQKYFSASQALAEGQKLTDEKLRFVLKSWDSVKNMAVERGADKSYLDVIDTKTAEMQEVIKNRIHNHAMSQVGKNAWTLDQDNRFSGHSDQEITKAAYWRGFAEKKAFFEQTTPDMNKIDTVFSNQETLKNIPDIPDLKGMENEITRNTKSVTHQRSDDISL